MAVTCERKSDWNKFGTSDIPTIVIFSSFDVRLGREISSETSRKMSFQNDSSGDWGGRIRVMSSRALCKAVRVDACPNLSCGWVVVEAAKGDLSTGGVEEALWVIAAVAWKRECADAFLAVSQVRS